MNAALLLLVGTLFVLAIAIGAYLIYQRLTASIDIEVPEGMTMPIPTAEAAPTMAEASVQQRLLDAGLNSEPALGDTAVSGHIERLEAGQVSADALLQYADDLDQLNKVTATQNGPIPTDFWDVRTEEMTANGWDEYGIEEENVLIGHAETAEAKADMALNNAIHSEFAPIYRQDRRQAVERLRCVLKEAC